MPSTDLPIENMAYPLTLLLIYILYKSSEQLHSTQAEGEEMCK